MRFKYNKSCQMLSALRYSFLLLMFLQLPMSIVQVTAFAAYKYHPNVHVTLLTKNGNQNAKPQNLFYSPMSSYNCHHFISRGSFKLFAADSNLLRSKFHEITKRAKTPPSNATMNSYKSEWILHLYPQNSSEYNYFPSRSRRKRGVQMQLLKPLQVMLSTPSFSHSSYGAHHVSRTSTSKKMKTALNIFNSSGFAYDDGEQILISAQKPLGLLLEERQQGAQSGCVVVQVEPGSAADKAGVQVGDVVLAVQNANVEQMNFEQVMARIQQAPKVVNLRFWRGDASRT